MSVTEEIKARIDIVNLVSQYVPQLKRSGRSYSAPCPFHAERTPSFFVFPDTQTWRCFGACGEGGDIFSFVMKQEGLDFSGALHSLAEKAGVQLRQRTPEQASQDQRLDKLRGLLGEAQHFFHEKLLKSREAEHARAYVAKRGLSEETIDHFGIGYAPDDWQQALEHLVQIGYTEAEVVETGVAIVNEEKGRVYDRFRNRLMIPISDGRGQIIGFGARALNKDDNPKYLNSPQSALFDKGATLFGLHLARRSIRESETAIIVEGYMDAIQAHQAGFTNVVAQMGTALTEPQLKQLSRYANRLILALDPDVAGIKATMRGLNVARETLEAEVPLNFKGLIQQTDSLNIDMRVMTLPEGQDPDDLIRENPAQWQQLVEEAQPVAQYIITAGTAGLTLQSSFAEREKVARELLPILLANENSQIELQNVQLLAMALHIKETTLIEWAGKESDRAKKAAEKHALASLKEQKKLAMLAPVDSQEFSVLLIPSEGNRTQRTVSTFALEQFCLAEMLRDSKLYYYANRRLREIASEVATRLREPLGPLAIQDFTRSDYQMIFRWFEAALVQDDHDPLEFMESHLPPELHQEVAHLLMEQFEIYKGRLMLQMHRDWEILIAERGRVTYAPIRPEDEFARQTLELRKQRLKRENVELQYLQQELLEENNSERDDEYVAKVRANREAIGTLDRAIIRMSASLREQR